MLVECTNIWLNTGLKDESQEIANWAKDSLHAGSSTTIFTSMHSKFPNLLLYGTDPTPDLKKLYF